MMRLGGALGALVVAGMAAHAAPSDDPRFVVNLPGPSVVAAHAPAAAARKAAQVLWRRLLPEGTAPPTVTPLTLVERIVPAQTGGVRVVFRRDLVRDWLQRHAVPFLVRPPHLALRVRVLDAFGPRPDWQEAARVALPALAGDAGIVLDPEGEEALLLAYVARGQLTLSTEPATRTRTLMPPEERLHDPAFWRSALAPLVRALRDALAHVSRAGVSVAGEAWGCVVVHVTMPWSEEGFAHVEQVLAQVPGVQAVQPVLLASDGVRIRLTLAEEDVLPAVRASLDNEGMAWRIVPPAIGAP